MSAVFAIRLIEVRSEEFDRLYGEIASFMHQDGLAIPGCLELQLFGSEDRTRIVIVAGFRSRKDWCHAQWNGRLGELLEEIMSLSLATDFNLYDGDRFTSPAVPS